jgi:hypothetical protein
MAEIALTVHWLRLVSSFEKGFAAGLRDSVARSCVCVGWGWDLHLSGKGHISLLPRNSQATLQQQLKMQVC